MSFVVGQKVICTNNLLVDHLSLGICYEVTDDYVYQNLTQVRNDLGELFWYDSYRFREYEPKQEEKEMTERYEVVEPFTLVDIWDVFKENHSCKEFLSEWGNLFKEQMGRKEAHCIFDTFNDIEYSSKVLMRNLHHLEEKGLIKKIHENIILKPGMRLKGRKYGNKYTVVESGDGSEFNKICLVGDGHEQTDFKPYVFSFGDVFDRNIALDELNRITDYGFEVIDGD